MARTPSRHPGRTLLAFFVGLAVMFGLVALAGTWKPELGLDLQGGTRITLVAKGSPTAENLEEARSIIDQRVNGSGVAEAEVTTQGNRFIVVEIPGKSRRNLVDTVKRQAQLRFRLVACSTADPGPCASAAGATQGGAGVTAPQSGTVDPGAGAQRAPVGFSDAASPSAKSSAKASAKASGSASPSSAASGTPEVKASGSASPSGSASAPAEGGKGSARFDKAVAFMNSPSAEWAQKFGTYQCPTSAGEIKDVPDQPLLTCDDQGQVAYLLTPAIIEGTQVTDASSGIPQNDVQYAVTLDFNGSGRKTFADATGAIAGTGQQFAIVLDGQVISAPTAEGRISGGAQITGGQPPFTQQQAQDLATSLKFGALPIAFEKDVSSEVVGPSLAGNQLQAGLLAGAIGLALVMLYCLIYYRGLGIVVLASLAVAAGATYGLVLLLSKTAGFTLTLPGIAGLIIAVGITADSFIIFFERIRDEMREGRSMRVAVESGWVRAKVTRLAANVVSLLSAAVLYIFATGVVKGFGFALGLSTVIDLAVLFWFTKPAVSFLARYRFFNGGGKLSGLSPESLGLDAPGRVTAGGKA